MRSYQSFAAVLVVTWVLALSYVLPASILAAAEHSQIQPRQLQCEYRTDPRGIDQPQPRLSWVLESVDPQSAARGMQPTAYQVLVSSSEQLLQANRGDLWNSGRVSSDALFNVIYSGQSLPSWQSCFWKVRVWDQEGHRSKWSEPASWTMGLLTTDDWKDAQWIGINEAERPVQKGAEAPEGRRLAARQLRREFDVAAPVRSATVALCGLGLSELYLNGKKVSDEVLSPPLTEFNKRAMYVIYDVTSLLKPGQNVAGVWLGNGRYWAPRSKEVTPTRTFGPPKMRVILRIEYADGAVREIVSDKTWKATDRGPIRANNEYDGEEYDARMELAGWAEPGYDDAAWKSADILPPPGGVLSARRSPAIRVTETRKPIARTSPKPGVYLFDFGQNLVGWCRLQVKGSPGTVIRLRHAETLQADDMLYVANLRSAARHGPIHSQGRWQRSLSTTVHVPRFSVCRSRRLPWRTGDGRDRCLHRPRRSGGCRRFRLLR